MSGQPAVGQAVRKHGGRAYALSARAMTHVAVLTYGWAANLGAMTFRGQVIDQHHLVPLILGMAVIGTLGGAHVLPNIAERWGGRSSGQPQNGGGDGQP